MFRVAITHVTDELRELVERISKSSCTAFQSLRDQLAEATRNREYEKADRIQAEMAKYLVPEKPAVEIVGGQGGYLQIDGDLFSAWRETR